MAAVEQSKPATRTVLASGAATRTVEQIGVWDLVGELGYLPDVLEHLDAAQCDFRFVEILAALVPGIVAPPARVREWAREHLPDSDEEQLAEAGANLIASAFWPHANRVRRELGLTWLAAITPSEIMADPQHDNEGELAWNRTIVFMPGIIVISSRDLRRQAAALGKTPEQAVATLLVACTLAATEPSLTLASGHGDLFDLRARGNSASGWDLRAQLERPTISWASLAAIRSERRAAAAALVDALATYVRP